MSTKEVDDNYTTVAAVVRRAGVLAFVLPGALMPRVRDDKLVIMCLGICNVCVCGEHIFISQNCDLPIDGQPRNWANTLIEHSSNPRPPPHRLALL